MRRSTCLVFLVAAFTTACSGPTVDLTKGLQTLDVATGWADAGIVGGQNKIVPSISLSFKNVSDQTLGSLQVNALFRRVNEPDEWGSTFLTAAGATGLAPGATTSRLVIVSPRGYTSPESRLDIMKSSLFKDARVEVFVKYAATQWSRLGEYPIERRLLDQ